MPSLLKYALRRLVLLIPTVFIVVTAIFFLFNVLPGNAALVYLGQESKNAVSLAQIRQMMGLNVPVGQRYVTWLNDVIHGNLGNSLLTNESVSTLVFQALPVTLLLASMAATIGIIAGVCLGIISALWNNTKYDVFASVVSLFGISIPTFWLGLILILIFSVSLGWLPPGGFLLSTFYNNPLEGLSEMILPAVTLSGALIGNLARMTRSSMLEILSQEYVIAARAKGLKETIVVFKHAFKNAMIPVVTISGLQIASLVGGATITETVFRLPGLGQLVVYAVLNRDFPIVEGVVLVVAIMLIFVNLIIDLFYKFLDPRIRLQ